MRVRVRVCVCVSVCECVYDSVVLATVVLPSLPPIHSTLLDSKSDQDTLRNVSHMKAHYPSHAYMSHVAHMKESCRAYE